MPGVVAMAGVVRCPLHESFLRWFKTRRYGVPTMEDMMFAKHHFDDILQDPEKRKALINYFEPSRFEGHFLLFLLLMSKCPDEMEESVIDWTRGGESIMQKDFRVYAIRQLYMDVILDKRIPPGLLVQECPNFNSPTWTRFVSNFTPAQLSMQGRRTKNMLVNRVIRTECYDMLQLVLSRMDQSDLLKLNEHGFTTLQDAVLMIKNREIKHTVDRRVYYICETACKNGGSDQFEIPSENDDLYHNSSPGSIVAMIPFEDICEISTFDGPNHAMVQQLLVTGAYIVHCMLECHVPDEHKMLRGVCKQWRDVSWAIAAGTIEESEESEESEERAKKRVKLNKEGAGDDPISRLPDAVVHVLLSQYVPCWHREALDIHEITNEDDDSLYDIVKKTRQHLHDTIPGENKVMYAKVLEAMDALLKVLNCIKDECEREGRGQPETAQANPLRLQLELEQILVLLK